MMEQWPPVFVATSYNVNVLCLRQGVLSLGSLCLIAKRSSSRENA